MFFLLSYENYSSGNLPSVDREVLCVVELDDVDRLDLSQMLMVDPKLPSERKRHQVLLKIKTREIQVKDIRMTKKTYVGFECIVELQLLRNFEMDV